jgi:Gpi18-like mannosyltransferase
MLVSQQKALRTEGLIFATTMWLLSRLAIAIAMLLIAPSIPAPPWGRVPIPGWKVFSSWDSLWYEEIATGGYSYADDGAKHPVAFFPFFPLLVRGVMSLGLPFEVAGTLVSSFAFLGALIVLYFWVDERHGRSAARWATATLAWSPMSFFGTVIYTEGLFLFLTTAALRAFDNKQHLWAAFWGALATATRITGLALMPTFLLVSWREGRSAIAYIASLVTGAGLLLYSLYCAFDFGDPLVFLKAQKAWRNETSGFNWWTWLKLPIHIAIGQENWLSRSLVNPWYPFLFVTLCGSAGLLWYFRRQLNPILVGYGFFVLGLFLCILGNIPLNSALMVFGGLYLLWYSRHKIGLLPLVYGLFAYGVILGSGSTMSVNRFAFAIVSVAIALALVVKRFPRWGYATLCCFAILLASFSVQFAQGLWVG